MILVAMWFVVLMAAAVALALVIFAIDNALGPWMIRRRDRQLRALIAHLEGLRAKDL